MTSRLEYLVAWLPFLAAILLAFGAGFAFARICQGRPIRWPRSRHTRHTEPDRIDYSARSERHRVQES